MVSYLVKLPIPPTILRPNSRSHWGKKSKVTKKMRFLSSIAFKKDIPELYNRLFEPYESVTIQRLFYFKTNRRRDKDNFNAGTKAFNDGMVDSGLLCDDSGDHIIWMDSKLIYDKTIAEDYCEYRIEA